MAIKALGKLKSQRPPAKGHAKDDAPPAVPHESPSVAARRKKVKAIVEKDLKRWRQAWDELAKH